jgi:hypothetical protein
MKKIISLFQRDYAGTRLVYDELAEAAEWVQGGEGVATIKWDGTACLVQDGRLFKRYDAKKAKTPPADFIPAQDPDAMTGHWPGWVPVGDEPTDKWFRSIPQPIEDGTYEFIGPKVNGNPYGLATHQFVKHGDQPIEAPRGFEELKAWFDEHYIEGIVWHHADGRMVKIKRRDFGYSWPPKEDRKP